jgi:hypothetical protein
MTTDSNPFTGRTRYRSRPAWSLPEYRHLTLSDLHRAQTHWDHAEQVRLAQSAAEAARFAELIADESVEEPASKALENRLRVAFLSRAGATMQDWLHHRPTILSSATAGPRSSFAVPGADLERRTEPC